MITVVCFLAAAAPGNGATASRLEEFLSGAERFNVDRRMAATQAERAGWDLAQAWTSLLPSVTGQGGYTRNQYNFKISLPSTDPDTGLPRLEEHVVTPFNQLDAALRVEVPLVDVQRWVRLGAANANDEAAEYRSDAASDGIERATTAAFYGYAGALAVRQAAQRSAKVAETQAQLTKVRFDAGAVTELDTLRARAEVERTKQTVADADALVATARRGLQSLSGLEPSDHVDLPADDLHPEADWAELEKNVAELPAVQAADAEAKAAGVLVLGSWLNLAPMVNAHFTERVSNYAGLAGHDASFTTGLNFVWRLDVPTFLGIGSTATTEQLAALAAERARLTAKDQIHSDWQRLNAALVKIGAAEAQVQAAQRAAQVSRDRYAAGASTQLEVIQAERDVFGAEVGHIQARTELASARAFLRISAGLADQNG